MESQFLKHAHGELMLDHCLVMGIVNRTPDSFFDGGRMGLSESFDHSVRLAEGGADVLDLGAVKAGPGEAVSESEEAKRLLPLVERVANAVETVISVETGRPAVARAAIDAGAAMVNDVSGLTEPQLAVECAALGAALIVMHHGGQIRGRPRNPRYEDVVTDVLATWGELVEVCEKSGVASESIIVDPGLDFGKTTYHSLELMRRMPELVAWGLPVLVAPSHKDVVGETLDQPSDERLDGTLALVALSVAAGAAIVRVHDVGAAVRTARMVEAVMGRRLPAAPVRGLWE
jgi:dihydropteroate synthase